VSIAGRDCVGTLLGEDSHQLFKRPGWLTDFEVNFDSIAVNEVRSEWRIVEGIEPVPALDSFVVVRVDPCETLAV
jgi:hypothetical protein